MKKILFIAPHESPHILRVFDFFNNQSGIESRLIICKLLLNTKNILTLAYSLITLRKRILKIYSEFNPDIVNFHTVLFPNYLVINKIKCKIVITPWNGDILWYKYGKDFIILKYFMRFAKTIKEKQIKNALNKAHLITCNSYEMINRVNSLIKYPIPVEKIQIPGVSSDIWIKVSPHEKNIIREELNLPINSFLVFSPRALWGFYNIDIIISGFYEALKYDQNLTLLIKYFSSDILSKLQKLIKYYKIQNHVLFIGKCSYSDVLKYFRASDLCISLSSRDSSPQTVIESLSCEVPIIVGDIPVIHELIKNEQTGFIIPLKDPNKIAEKIIYIKNNQKLVEKITQNGRKFVIQEHDYHTNMNKMDSLFRSL